MRVTGMGTVRVRRMALARAIPARGLVRTPGRAFPVRARAQVVARARVRSFPVRAREAFPVLLSLCPAPAQGAARASLFHLRLALLRRALRGLPLRAALMRFRLSPAPAQRVFRVSFRCCLVPVSWVSPSCLRVGLLAGPRRPVLLRAALSLRAPVSWAALLPLPMRLLFALRAFVPRRARCPSPAAVAGRFRAVPPVRAPG